MTNISSAKKLYSTFKELGYFKIDNFFENKVIDEIKSDLNNIITDKPKEIIFYHDRNNLLRRIEKFFSYTIGWITRKKKEMVGTIMRKNSLTFLLSWTILKKKMVH